MPDVTELREVVFCQCEDWQANMKVFEDALHSYKSQGVDTTAKRFELCPYCGKELQLRIARTETPAEPKQCPAATSILHGSVVYHDRGLFPVRCLLVEGHEGPHRTRLNWWPNHNHAPTPTPKGT